MAAFLAQIFQSVLNPIAVPIRNEFSNLALRVLIAVIFSALAIFSGIQSLQALHIVLQDVIFGPEIEIAAFFILSAACVAVVVATLRRKPKPAAKEIDFNKLFSEFLSGVIAGATSQPASNTSSSGKQDCNSFDKSSDTKKEAPRTEPLS